MLIFIHILPIVVFSFIILQILFLLYSIFSYKSNLKNSNLNKQSFNFKKEKSQKLRSIELSIAYLIITVIIAVIALFSIIYGLDITIQLFTVFLTTLTILALLQFFTVAAYKSQKNISHRFSLRYNFFIIVMLLFSIFATVTKFSQILVIIFLFGVFYSFFKDFALVLFINEPEIGYLTSIVNGSSMNPALMDEDIVLALTDMKDGDIEPGDIIMYEPTMNYSSRTPIIHRVQNINDTVVTLRGDNANVIDRIHYASILGIVIAVIRNSDKFIVNSKYNKYIDIIEKFYSGELSFKYYVKYPLISEYKIIISMVMAIICAIIISFI